MPLVESFRTKRELDRLAGEIGTRLRLPIGQRKLNKGSVRRLLGFTGFTPARVRDLEIFVRPLEGEKKIVVVLDNELPIYHTTVPDVGLRKTPSVKEMLVPRNIKRILNDKDVVMSRGEESLRRIYNQAFTRLDFSYEDREIDALVRDARQALEENSLDRLQEDLELFLELLGYERVPFPLLGPATSLFGVQRAPGEVPRIYQDLILFDREELELLLVRGGYSPERQDDADRLLAAATERKVDAQGGEVLEFLGRMARRMEPSRRGSAIRGAYAIEEEVLEAVE